MRPVSIIWTTATTTGTIGGVPNDTRSYVSLPQSVAGGQPFIINGVLATPSTNTGPLITVPTFGGGLGLVPTNSVYASLFSLRQARTIGVYAAAAQTSVTFTVTGTYLGAVVSDTIDTVGANALVSTGQYFDTVTSITPDIDTVGPVSVGLGIRGQFSWILYNNHATQPSLTVQAYVASTTGGNLTGNITYQFASTLDEITEPASIIGQTVGLVVPDGDVSAPQAFKTIMDGTYSAPTNAGIDSGTTTSTFRYYTMQIGDQSDGGEEPTQFDGQLIVTFVQAGII